MRIFGPTGKSSRSASMQLSINAIVILVLAMAVLGLGLGLVKGIKGKVNLLLDKDIDLDEDASASDPLVNFRKQESMTIDKESIFTISVYNKNSDCEDTNSANIEIVCSEGLEGSIDLNMQIRQRSIELPNGQPVGVQFGATPVSHDTVPENGFQSGENYFCDLIITCGNNADAEEVARWAFNLEI